MHLFSKVINEKACLFHASPVKCSLLFWYALIKPLCVYFFNYQFLLHLLLINQYRIETAIAIESAFAKHQYQYHTPMSVPTPINNDYKSHNTPNPRPRPRPRPLRLYHMIIHRSVPGSYRTRRTWRGKRYFHFFIPKSRRTFVHTSIYHVGLCWRVSILRYS